MRLSPNLWVASSRTFAKHWRKTESSFFARKIQNHWPKPCSSTTFFKIVRKHLKIRCFFIQKDLCKCMCSLMLKKTVVFDPIFFIFWSFLGWEFFLQAKKSSNFGFELICFAASSGRFCKHASIQTPFQFSDLGFPQASLKVSEELFDRTILPPKWSFDSKVFLTCITSQYGEICKSFL